MKNSNGLHMYEDIFARLKTGERPTPMQLADEYGSSETSVIQSAYRAGRIFEEPVYVLDGQLGASGPIDETERVLVKRRKALAGHAKSAALHAQHMQELVAQLPAAKQKKYEHWLPFWATLRIMGEQAKYLEAGKPKE